MRFLSLLLLSFSIILQIECQQTKKKFVIGAIFEDEGDNDLEIAFKASLRIANSILNNSRQIWNTMLVAAIERIPPSDSFEASNRACDLLQKEPIALFGPGDTLAGGHVRSIANQFGIPYLETSWGYRHFKEDYSFSLNFHPYYKSFGEALKAYIQEAEAWDTLFIIYYSEESLLKFQDLINTYEDRVMLRRWRKTDQSYKYLMKYLLSSKQHRFIVDIPYYMAKEFVNLAIEYNMTDTYYSYIFTDPDMALIDISNLKQNYNANFTTISFLKDDTEYKSRSISLEEMRNDIFNAEKKKYDVKNLEKVITHRAALVFDAVLTLASALRELSKYEKIYPSKFTCTDVKQWATGKKIIETVKKLPEKHFEDSLTDYIGFDNAGWRTMFKMRIIILTNKGYQQFGYWKNELVITKKLAESKKEIYQQLRNATLRVTTISDKPFSFRKNENTVGSSNPDDWDGFCVQLVELVAKECGFNFTIHEVGDGQYGSVNGTKDGKDIWNGMIGELINRQADLAVAPLTITYAREKAIDFTTPYMSLGLSIVFKKPEGKKPDLFSFLQPLSLPVWGYVLAAYISVAFAFFVVARFTPYEWYSPHLCYTDSGVVENQYTMLNCLWFTVCSLMQQGSDITPRANSTRVIAGIWWFFCLIIISSYTANLAAFLTIQRMKAPIESAEDLSKQTKIKYGVLKGGSSENFFKKSTIDTYQKMWEFMSKHTDVLASSTQEGIQKVLRGNYAFILESTMNEYYSERNCSLMQVGGLLDSKGYGIGLPQGSPYRDPISEAILRLQNLQKIDALRRYWFSEYNITKPCSASGTKQKDTTSLGISEVGGVFVMLLMGIGISFLVSLVEFFYKTRQLARKEDKNNVCQRIITELKFAINCTNPPRKYLSTNNNGNIPNHEPSVKSLPSKPNSPFPGSFAEREVYPEKWCDPGGSGVGVFVDSVGKSEMMTRLRANAGGTQEAASNELEMDGGMWPSVFAHNSPDVYL